MKVLAIESSCDETSASVVELTENSLIVLSTVTATSLNIHATTGGIIPENAAREQVRYIMPVIIEALNKSGVRSRELEVGNWNEARAVLTNDIDAIAVTYGPGLIGSLLVGVETAKTLAFSFNKPIIPVNHLLGHIYANFIQTPNSKLPSPIYPFIGLIVSGAHTDLLYFKSTDEFEWLGGTRDDAAGEAFDKIGRTLGFPYPAGPEIERRSNLLKKSDVGFKSPLLNEDNFDFSFSGLKTEASRYFQTKNVNLENENLKNEICYATQKAIIDVIVKKTLKAALQYNCSNILIGGGVASNSTLQKKLEAGSLELGIKTFTPEKIYCTDNAAMIGAYALMHFKPVEWKKVVANPELYFA